MIINADTLGFNLELTNPIKIYFNTPLFNLYSTLPVVRLGENATNGKNFLLKFIDEQTNILNLDTYNAIQLIQENSTSSFLNPVASIAFTSDLPIISTLVSQPKIFGINSSLITNTPTNNIVDLITDMVADSYQNEIQYQPTIYRFIDMMSATPIRNINITCFWYDKYGFAHQSYLPSGGMLELKLMFKLKGIN
jgi:hypothetical protein